MQVFSICLQNRWNMCYILPLNGCIIIHVRQRKTQQPLTEGSEEMSEGMTNAQLNEYLETLAKLVESKAKTVEEAAEIIREAKTK